MSAPPLDEGFRNCVVALLERVVQRRAPVRVGEVRVHARREEVGDGARAAAERGELDRRAREASRR